MTSFSVRPDVACPGCSDRPSPALHFWAAYFLFPALSLMGSINYQGCLYSPVTPWLVTLLGKTSLQHVLQTVLQAQVHVGKCLCMLQTLYIILWAAGHQAHLSTTSSVLRPHAETHQFSSTPDRLCACQTGDWHLNSSERRGNVSYRCARVHAEFRRLYFHIWNGVTSVSFLLIGHIIFWKCIIHRKCRNMTLSLFISVVRFFKCTFKNQVNAAAIFEILW